MSEKKYLDTAGLTYFWGKVKTYVNNGLNKKQDTLTFDDTPTKDSTNPVKSGGIKTYIDTNLATGLGTKQDKLTFDDTPTKDSTNPVTSGGIKAYIGNGLSGKQDTITASNKLSASLISGLASVATSGSYKDLNNQPDGADIYYDNENTVAGSIKQVVDSLMANKQNILNDGTEDIHINKLTLGSGSATNITKSFADTTPSETLSASLTTASSVIDYISGKNYATQTSLNEGLAEKQNKLTFDDTPTKDSTNPVTSGGVYTALSGKQNTITAFTDLALNSLHTNSLTLGLITVSNITSIVTDTAAATALPTAAGVVNYVSSKISALGDVLVYKGTKANYIDLLTINPSKGDVYNVTNAYDDYPAGTNFAWNGTAWDALGGAIDLSGYQLKSDLVAITTGEINDICAA